MVSFRITLRYEIPGFAFIGLVVLLIWKPVVATFIASGIPASVLAAFTVFVSGPPFGFLITQLWYILFHKFWYWEGSVDEEPLKTFVGYGVVNEVRKARTALNYLYHNYERKARIFLYRRINLYHSVCSTFLALLTGVGVGYAVRWIFGATLPFTEGFEALDWRTHVAIWLSLFFILLILWFAKEITA